MPTYLQAKKYPRASDGYILSEGKVIVEEHSRAMFVARSA
jgi:hypothetical protein